MGMRVIRAGIEEVESLEGVGGVGWFNELWKNQFRTFPHLELALPVV
jgi:hypothetical protein